MDIYVQPSLNEGMGRTVVMAEILSKPIIASSVCGLKDLITDAYNGYLVEPKNSLELAMKIYELFKNEDLRKNMGQKSFELVNREENGFKYYSFEREYLLYKKLYMGA
jgi:N,N'-diacetylbacillosaminyl-diphospho-undecaprenol alpha-1,3-N-acetylgalactosaminyltransferase